MPTRAPCWVLALFLAFFCALSAWWGPDASWDLRNYHLYDGHAAVAGTLWSDIAPAQLQSFYDPFLDAALFLLRRALNAYPAILGVVLAAPQALAAWLGVTVALRVGLPLGLAVIAVWFGATGAGGLPTLGTAMSEAVPTCLLLGALAVALDLPRHPHNSLSAWAERAGVRWGARRDGSERVRCERALVPPHPGPLCPGGEGAVRRNGLSATRAGFLAGIALGLKLTLAPYALGLAVTAGWWSLRRFTVGLLVGVALLAAPWWWIVWRHTGNPLFPYFNEVFRSPWAPSTPMTDTRFLPPDALHAALFPLYWAFSPSHLVSELPVRDPRLALAWLGWIGVITRSAIRCQLPHAPVRILLVFWVVSFVAWEARFSVLRYTAPLEFLAGIPVVLALAPLGAGVLAPVFALAAALTICPDWGRASGPLVADVRPPTFLPGTMVVLLDPAPMAYVAAFSPSSIRFIGADSNLVHPGEDTALARAIAEAIAHHAGPLWGLESPADQPGEADRTLATYGLARAAPCARVRSNLDADAILACPLIHAPRARATTLSSTPSPRLIAIPASASSTRAANMRGISSR